MWFLKRHKDHINPETLSEFLDGRISASEHDKWEIHFESCANCEEELDSLRYTVGLLRRVPMVTPRRIFTLGVAPKVTPVRSGVRAPAWAYGAATSVAVLVFAVVLSADLTGLLSEDVSGPSGLDQVAEAQIATTGTLDQAVVSEKIEMKPAFDATPQPAQGQQEITPEVINEVVREVVTEREAVVESAITENAAQAIPPPEVADVAIEMAAPAETANTTPAPAVQPVAPGTEVTPKDTDTPDLADMPVPLPQPEESAQLLPPTPEAETATPVEAASPQEADGATSLLWHVLEGVSGAAALILLGWSIWRARRNRVRAAS